MELLCKSCSLLINEHYYCIFILCFTTYSHTVSNTCSHNHSHTHSVLYLFSLFFRMASLLRKFRIFHNPYCLYADPIRYCLCEIYSCIYLVRTWYSVNYSIVRVLYIQPKVHVHVVTGIFSLGCTHLQIVLV